MIAGLFFWIERAVHSGLAVFLKIYGDNENNHALLLAMPSVFWFFLIPFFVYSRLASTLSYFFQNADHELVLSLPVSTRALFWRNFLTGWRPILLFEALIVYPAWIGYRRFLGGSAAGDLLFWFVLTAVSLLPQVIGVLIPLVLLRISSRFSSRQTFYWVALLFVLACFFVGRIFVKRMVWNPGDPQWIGPAVDALIALEAKNWILEPVFWPSRILKAWLEKKSFWDSHLDVLKLGSLGLVSLFVLDRLAALTYSKNLSLVYEAQGKKNTSDLPAQKRSFLFSRSKTATHFLLQKDLVFFFREPSQWTQMLMLLIFFAGYWWIYQRLPMTEQEIKSQSSFDIQKYFSLLALALLQITVAARFVFPTFSLESKAIWILKTASIQPKELIHAKQWYGVIFVFGSALVESLILRLGTWENLIFFFSQSLVFSALALELGAKYPRLDRKNAAALATSWGGLIFSVICLFWIVFCSVGFAWLMERGVALKTGATILWLLFCSLLARWLSMRALKAWLAMPDR